MSETARLFLPIPWDDPTLDNEMTHKNAGRDPSSVSEQLPDPGSVIEKLVAGLPAGVAAITKGKRPDGEVYVRVEPRNLSASPIEAWGGGHIRYYVYLGKTTNLEILSGSTAVIGVESPVEALQAICSAVFAGDFEETIWRVGGRISKSLSRLVIRGEVHTIRGLHGFYVLGRRRKEHLTYAPY